MPSSNNKIDPAILEALGIEEEDSRMVEHGGSGFARTFKIIGRLRSGDGSGEEVGKEKMFFVKIGRDGGMFAGEHMSLNAIHDTVPNFCPKSYAHGKLSSSQGYFLATDFLDLSSSSSKPSSGTSLAEKLATLHSAPAPIPEGYTEPQFGFPVSTCCGDTVQDNSFKSSWSEFYSQNRLLGVLSAAEKNNGSDPELRALVQKTVDKVVPRLLSESHLKDGTTGEDIKPVVVHGDLWSGNKGVGSIGDGGREEVVFDPAGSWSHGEFEGGIMGMFGGFSGGFWKEYHRFKPKDRPVEEWEDRRELYELYHHLNHYSIFGGGYKGGAMRIMKNLLKKYGN